jgi:predicted TIM-barrel fold metal-dependent hydrolase
MTAIDEAPTRIDSAPDPLGGIWFVDCDAHFTEPPDLWSARMPASSNLRVPQLKTMNGESNWFLGDDLFAPMGGNSIRKGRKRVHGTLTTIQPFEAIDPSSWSVSARLAFMDDMGMLAQIVYPNGIGFSSNYIFALDDDAERVAILQAYNDFYVDVQRESGGRLLSQALLPVWDIDFTVKEMTRLLDQGITGFCLTDRPELLGLPELCDPYFEPMWDVFNESGAVANFHIGAGITKQEFDGYKKELEAHLRGEEYNDPSRSQRAVAPAAWLSLPPQRRLTAQGSQFFMSNARVVCNLLVSDLFDRFPKLKVMSAESGIGWVPFVVESLEYHFDDMIVERDERAFAKRRPREYFQDHLYVTFWFERTAPQKLLEDIGINNVMVETDFPHPTCLFPDTRARLAAAISGVSDDVKARVLRDNAIDLYGIDVAGR